ncbi:MAG: hypothetical protein D8H99_57900, partial [Streptococcus sp.]
MSLLNIVKKRTEQSMGLTEAQINKIINEDESVLHNPFLYDGMDKLITLLYEFKQEQLKYPYKLLIIDTDYDTDGIRSAAVLSAALDVFNINYRVYIPSMNDGYGLNRH